MSSSGKNILYHGSAHTGQTDIEPLNLQCESRVIDTQQMKHRGMEVVATRFHPATRDGVGERLM
jgi:hypothetical protein